MYLSMFLPYLCFLLENISNEACDPRLADKYVQCTECIKFIGPRLEDTHLLSSDNWTSPNNNLIKNDNDG